MKRNIVLFAFILSGNMAALAQSPVKKQTHIPLSNLKGIPYTFADRAYYVGGFDVDDSGNYYFLNGDNVVSTLVKFNGDKLIYRKKSKDYTGIQFYISGNNLFVLNYLSHSLYAVDKDGNLLKAYSHFTNKPINTSRFLDTMLVLDVLNSNMTLNYYAYSLSGKFYKNTQNPFDLPNNIYAKNRSVTDAVYIGKWNDKYVFWDVDSRRQGYEKYWLVNVNGDVLKTRYYQSKVFGETFEIPENYEKIKNNTIYVFGHNGTDGIITELSLSDMFN